MPILVSGSWSKCALHSKQDRSVLLMGQGTCDQCLITTVWLAHFFWLAGELRTGPHMHWEESVQGRPISAEKCGSASAGKCAPEEACHQSSLLLQACSTPFPYLVDGERRGKNDCGHPVPWVTTDCTGSIWIDTLLSPFHRFFCPFICIWFTDQSGDILCYLSAKQQCFAYIPESW